MVLSVSSSGSNRIHVPIRTVRVAIDDKVIESDV